MILNQLGSTLLVSEMKRVVSLCIPTTLISRPRCPHICVNHSRFTGKTQGTFLFVFAFSCWVAVFPESLDFQFDADCTTVEKLREAARSGWEFGQKQQFLQSLTIALTHPSTQSAQWKWKWPWTHSSWSCATWAVRAGLHSTIEHLILNVFG